MDDFLIKKPTYIIKNSVMPTPRGGVFKIIYEGSEAILKLSTINLEDEYKTDKNYRYEDTKEEITILQDISHKNIVKLYNVIIDTYKNRIEYRLIQEDCGIDLLELAMMRKPPAQKIHIEDPEIVRNYFRQLADALVYLHSHKIYHGDISAENVLVKNDIIKLIDFGMAGRNPEKLQKCFKNIGKPGYSSIENWYQCHDPFKSDVWQFGVTLFCYMTACTCYIRPEDKYYKMLMTNFDEYLRLQHMTLHEDIIDLLKKIFVPEDKRLDIFQFRSYKFFDKVN